MIKPVAWMDGQGNLYRYPDDADRGQTMRPLYLEQPKREWIGFTDKEMADAVAETDWGELLWEVVCLTKIIEATLKEKNT